MNYTAEFERLMNTQKEIALATMGEDGPNVRIVNFYYEPGVKTLYFASFADNRKVAEVERNPKVAFTTMPTNGEEHVRVRAGLARKSALSAEDVKDRFLQKMPDYLMNIPALLPALTVLEITFSQADVVLDPEHMGSITL